MSKPQQSTTIQGRLKEDIDSTIDALEASIRGGDSKSSKKGSSSKKPQDPRHRIIHEYHSNRKKRGFIWGAVGFIAVAILGMWGWNMRTVFYDVSRGKYAAETPLNSVGSYFNEAMQIAGANDAQAEESETLRNAKDAIQNVVAASAATSTDELKSTSTLDTLAESLATHVSSTTSTDNTTTTP